MHPLIRGLLDLMFPPRCQVCGDFGAEVFCSSCRARVTRISRPHCLVCGAPFDPLAQSGELCAVCRAEGRHFDFARAVGLFETPLRELIHTFKYDGVRALARPLGELLAEYVADAGIPDLAPGDFELICPVPLHPLRESERGFNQAELLARVLAERFGVPVVRALDRVRFTRPQVLLPARARAANVRGAFSARGDGVAGKSVLLIDDVYTTGATLSECARMLRRAGASRVYVLTVARPHPGRPRLPAPQSRC